MKDDDWVRSERVQVGLKTCSMITLELNVYDRLLLSRLVQRVQRVLPFLSRLFLQTRLPDTR